MSRFVLAACLLSSLAAFGCSGSSESSSAPSDEGALEQGRSSTVDLKKYSLVVGLVTTNRADTEVLSSAILGTSKKADKSDRKTTKDQVFAGMQIEGEDEPVGIICGKDGATGESMCSLSNGLALVGDVTGREIDRGVLLPSKVKLTGKLADAVADALPKTGEGKTGAGRIECKKTDSKAECTVPLTGFGAATRLDFAVEQAKQDEGEAKAAELKDALEKLVGILF